MRQRCTCHRTDPASLLVQVGAVEAGLTYGIDPTCPAHGAVDQIIASGRYTDRQARMKHGKAPLPGEWWTFTVRPKFKDANSPAQMRLLIERDQHRDECVGLHWCDSHPVPRVHFNIHTGAPIVIAGDEFVFPDGGFTSHAEAMDAALALAVGP